MALQKSESRIQQEIFQHHWNAYPEERGLLFMVHNEARNKINGARMKGMGMVAGVSDMIYLKPGGNPIMLELKTPSGKQSTKQMNWEKKVTESGYRYFVVRSLEEAKVVCEWK